MHRLCVFCGSNTGADPAYAQAARRLGQIFARQATTLVYGGGSIGLMGVLADAVLEHGGRVIGVIPQALEARELGHRSIPELYVVDTMHERKAKMAALATGFVALPGGMGTLDEFCEIVTWAQLGIHDKPCALLNVAGYFDPFIRFIDQAVEQRFLKPEHRTMMLVDDDPEQLLERMRAFRPVAVPKWIDESKV